MGCGGSTSKAPDVRKPSAQPVPVLGYWSIQARGDPCRMLLHNLGIKFEDKKYNFGETAGPNSWPANKTKLGMAFPNLPYWKDADVIHSETLPVLRSICRRYCPQYMGRNQKEQAMADSFANTIYGGLVPWFGTYMSKPDYADKKEAGIAAGREYRDTIERCIGTKRFVAGDVTYADFITYWILKVLKLYEPSIVSEKPVIVAYMRNFAALKGILAAENAYKNLPQFSPMCAWWKDNMPGARPSAPKTTTAVAPTGAPATVPVFGYYNVQGRGDPCRLLLSNIGVKFEDKMYTFGDKTSPDSWEKSKGKLGMLFPNLPYWKDGDIIHSETNSILRSICRSYCPEYLGRNQTEQAYADTFLATIHGSLPGWGGPHLFMPDYADKHAEGVAAGKVYLEQIAKMIGNKRFVAGNNVTYADFMAYWILKALTMFDASIIQSNPKMLQYMVTFSELKGIREGEFTQYKLPPFASACAWQVGRNLNENALCFNFHCTVNPGKEAEFRALARQALSRTQTEETCLDYTWCWKDNNTAIIRDSYANADAFLQHKQNLGELFGQIVALAKLSPVEVSGTAEDWAKIRSIVEPMGAVFYEREYGFRNVTHSAIQLQPFFEIKPGKEAELKAHIVLLTNKAMMCDGILDYTVCFNGNKFIMREAYASPDALFAYAGFMGELLPKLHTLATIQKVDATGPEEDLMKLKPAIDPLGPIYYNKEVGLAVNDDALCLNFHCTINTGQESAFRANMQQAVSKAQTEKTCLDYTWCYKDNRVIIRESYANAEAFANHMQVFGQYA